jgi:hypothetical protein
MVGGVWEKSLKLNHARFCSSRYIRDATLVRRSRNRM